jgi:hypothetical protein
MLLRTYYSAYQIMADLVAFQAAFSHIGFNLDLQDGIVNQGIASLMDLLMFQKEQIKHYV